MNVVPVTSTSDVVPIRVETTGSLTGRAQESRGEGGIMEA